MSHYLGKKYVLEHYGDAQIVSRGEDFAIVSGNDILGDGSTPEGAWHDAAVEIDREPLVRGKK